MEMAPGVREILHYSLLKPNGITYPLPEFLIGGTLCVILQVQKDWGFSCLNLFN